MAGFLLLKILLVAIIQPVMATQKVIKAQVMEAAELLTQGLRNYEIIKIFSEKYGHSTRTTEARIKDARELIISEFKDIDREELLARILAGSSAVLRKSLQTNQLGCAVASLAQLARLTGLDKK